MESEPHHVAHTGIVMPQPAPPSQEPTNRYSAAAETALSMTAGDLASDSCQDISYCHRKLAVQNNHQEPAEIGTVEQLLNPLPDDETPLAHKMITRYFRVLDPDSPANSNKHDWGVDGVESDLIRDEFEEARSWLVNLHHWVCEPENLSTQKMGNFVRIMGEQCGAQVMGILVKGASFRYNGLLAATTRHEHSGIWSGHPDDRPNRLPPTRTSIT